MNRKFHLAVKGDSTTSYQLLAISIFVTTMMVVVIVTMMMRIITMLLLFLGKPGNTQRDSPYYSFVERDDEVRLMLILMLPTKPDLN